MGLFGKNADHGEHAEALAVWNAKKELKRLPKVTPKAQKALEPKRNGRYVAKKN